MPQPFGEEFDVRAGRHLRVLQQRAPGLGFAVDGLLAHFDLPALADTVVVAADHLAAPLDPVRAAFPGARVVVWQLGQISGGPTAHPVPRTIQHLRGADAVWEHDTLNAAYLGWRKISVERQVPVLDSLRPAPPPPGEPTVDVLFAGRRTPRRERIMGLLARDLGPSVRLAWAGGVGEADLNGMIADARIVLNLHAFEPWHRQEQTRIARALALGRMVVSEPSELNGYGPVVVEAREEHLAATLSHWLADDRWRGAGAAARAWSRDRAEAWLPVQGPRVSVSGEREEEPRRSAFVMPVPADPAPPAPPPGLVSQIWLTTNDAPLPPAIAAARRTLVEAFPGAVHRLWRMADLRRFIGEHYPPEVLRAFDRLRAHSHKSNIGRYCVLHTFGGWYADITTRMVAPPPTPPPGVGLLAWAAAAKQGAPASPLAIACGLLWARPGHDALRLAIEQAVRNAEDGIYGSTFGCVSGPQVLGEAITRLGPRPDILVGDCAPLTPGRPVENRAYVMPDGTIVAWPKQTGGGDLHVFGASGVNNHVDIWWQRQVYAPE